VISERIIFVSRGITVITFTDYNSAQLLPLLHAICLHLSLKTKKITYLQTSPSKYQGKADHEYEYHARKV